MFVEEELEKSDKAKQNHIKCHIRLVDPLLRCKERTALDKFQKIGFCGRRNPSLTATRSARHTLTKTGFISIYGFFLLSESGNACIYIKIPSSLDMEILRHSTRKCHMHCWRRICVTESSFICPQSPFWLADRCLPSFLPSFQLRESDPVRVPLRQLPQGLPPPAPEILPQEGARRRGGGGRRPAQVRRWHAQLSDHHKEAVRSLNTSPQPQ